VRNSLTVVSAIAIPFLRLWGVEGYYSPERLRVLLMQLEQHGMLLGND
jgi:hypothetical protein